MDNVDQADVICVETSHGAIVACTLSTVNKVLPGTTIFSLDYAYWERG